MLYNGQVEWRSPKDALKLDVSLVEHVFRRLARQSKDESSEKKHSPMQGLTSRVGVEIQGSQDLHISTNESDGNTLLPLSTQVQAAYFDPDMVFSKSDVLVMLEQSQGFLQKRPLLRMLHTNLACVSLEKEGVSVEGFVRFRVKERTLSFAMVRDRLLQIHTRVQQAIEFENQVQEFTSLARAKSSWCVRDWKSVHRSPSQFYKVHVLPVKPKTPKQLEAEQQVLASMAAGVVSNAVQLCVEKLVSQSRTAASGRRSVRSRTPQPYSTEGDAASRKPVTRSDPALRAKARKYREQAEAEARRRELRMQILIPAVERSVLLSSAVASSESDKQRATPTSMSSGSGGQATLAAVIEEDASTVGAVVEVIDGGQVSELNASSCSGKTSQLTKRAENTAKLLLVLAAAEANGDMRIAERLADQKIARSGFQRALEQAKNLGLAHEDYWGLLKIWKSVYRAHSLKSLSAAFAPRKSEILQSRS